MSRVRTEGIEPTCSICNDSSLSVSFTVHVIPNTLKTFFFHGTLFLMIFIQCNKDTINKLFDFCVIFKFSNHMIAEIGKESNFGLIVHSTSSNIVLLCHLCDALIHLF